MEAAFDLFLSQKWVPFSLNLSWDSNLLKKILAPPKYWQKFKGAKSHFDATANAIAIRTGEVSGIFVLDSDSNEKLKAFLDKHGYTLPPTVTVITGSGGRHYYYLYSPALQGIKSNSKVFQLDGQKIDVDIRSDGGMIIAPPTQYKKGSDGIASYTWLPGHAPGEIALAECPDWIIQELKKVATSSSKSTTPTTVTENSETQDFFVFKSLQDFILVKLRISPSKLNKLVYFPESETFTVQTTEKLCTFAGREHGSNHQYIVIKKNGKLVVRCHSKHITCVNKSSEEWILPEEIVKELHSLINLSEEVSKEIIEHAKADAKTMLNDHYEGNHKMEMMVRDDKSIGGVLDNYQGDKRCPKCKRGQIGCTFDPLLNGMFFKCTLCDFRFPKGQGVITVDVKEYGGLTKYFQIVLQQNIGTQNNYYGGGTQEIEIGWNEFVDDPINIIADPANNKILLKAMSGTHTRVGDLFVICNQDIVTWCPENPSKPWYLFISEDKNQTKTQVLGWKNVEEPYIKHLIRSDEFLENFVKVQKALENSSINNASAKIKQIKSILFKLETDSFQSSVLHQSQRLLEKPNFYDSLDKDKNLIGFNNGVYDLTKGEFRKYTPKDLVTMSVGYDYDAKVMFEDTQTIQEVMRFMESVFPDEDTCKYVFKFLASCLAGYTEDQLFHFGYGSGSNGKGILLKLMFETFGAYAGALSASFLTGKTPDADSPTPALTNIVGKRFVAISETVEGSKLNEQLFKSLCGQDRLIYRPMRQEAKEFDPDHKLFMILNSLPEFKGSDYAMTRRMRVIPFLSSFKENPDASKGEKKLDKALSQKVKGWKHAFMGLLLRAYSAYLCEGLVPSRQIEEATKKYQKDNDRYAEFLDEKCSIQNDSVISTMDLAASFMNWCVAHYGNDSLQSKIQKTHAGKLWEALEKEPWKGRVRKVKIKEHRNTFHFINLVMI